MTSTERVVAAIGEVLKAYADDIDGDDHLSMIRIEVRLRPGGSVRRVLVQRESEIGEHRT